MDPDAALKRIREILSDDGWHHGAHREALGFELTDLVTGLDQWLTTGGFPPAAWDPCLPCGCPVQVVEDEGHQEGCDSEGLTKWCQPGQHWVPSDTITRSHPQLGMICDQHDDPRLDAYAEGEEV